LTDRTITVDLSAPSRVADLPVLARRVFDWWLGELVALAPAWLTSRLPKPSEVALLFVRGENWRIVPGTDAAQAFELEAGVSDKEIADRILQIAPNFSLSRLVIVLPAQSVLRRRIELPLMPDASVRSAVELQIDRLSPFKADAVRFAVRVLERDVIEGKLSADVAIAPRAPVEQLEARLSALGLKPVAVDVEGGNGERSGFDLRAGDRTQGSQRAMLVTAALICGALLIWYLAIYAWGAARERQIAGWQSAVADLRPVAERSALLRRQLDGLIEPLAMARQHKAGLTLALLSELTQLLPDGARLTELRITGDTVDMTGLALDPPSLISKLEASKRFKDVKFRSPVTRRPEVGKDRFEISMKLEGEGGK
ncbi:MAG: PilN domain-containing protein, partial [Alphaproteobacteria bacterium]|nr:PilN domain-containing protein [Alphaproteobacteria bacterium]